MNILAIFIYAVVAAFLIVYVILYLRRFEKKQVYRPSHNIGLRPEDLGLEYEEIRFCTEDGLNLFAWLFRSPKAKATILFCHGNSGNVSHRFEIVKLLKALQANVFVFDYRGYGQSDGEVSEEGTYKDVVAAFDYVSEDSRIEGLPIVVYGESLGGAVAVELALRRHPAAVILDSTFASIQEMSKDRFPFLPVKLLGHIKYDSISKIDKLNTPVLVVHSREDDLIRFEHGVRLYEKARQPKEFFERVGSHGEGIFVNPRTYKDRISAFLNKYVFL